MRSVTVNSETYPNTLLEVRNDSQRAVRGRGHSRLLGDDLDGSRLKGRGCMDAKDQPTTTVRIGTIMRKHAFNKWKEGFRT